MNSKQDTGSNQSNIQKNNLKGVNTLEKQPIAEEPIHDSLVNDNLNKLIIQSEEPHDNIALASNEGQANEFAL